MHHAALETAFMAHRARVDAIFASGDWTPYADEFTPDATYRRPGHPLVEGREGIRAWAHDYFDAFPASEIASLDVVWHSIDTGRDAVVYEVRSTMRDPGDGSVHGASTTTSIFYGGSGLWRACVDMSNPRAYEAMYRNWARVALRHGLVSREEAGSLAPPA